MGEGAYIRIQNKSSTPVKMMVVEGRKVDEAGMDSLQGVVQPGQQLPPAGEGETPFGPGNKGSYRYIEGDVRFFFQGDGYFHLEAHPVEDGGGGSPSGLKLCVDHNSWWSEDKSPDADSPVKLVADVDDDVEKKKQARIEIRVFDNYDGKRWMSQMEDSISSAPLCRVKLPGTHDSGTYRFDKDMGASPDSDLTTSVQKVVGVVDALSDFVLGNIFARLCQCQNASVAEQLAAGIRYLDLRVAYHADSGTFWTCHGVYCVNVKEVLKEIDDFLSANSKEIVVLDFKNLYEMNGHDDELVGLIIGTLGDKAADNRKVKPSSPVSEYWDGGYQAVVVYNRTGLDFASYEGKVWHPYNIRSPWPEASDTDELRVKLKEKVERHYDANRFYVLQGVLTPDVELIKKQILDNAGVSIKSFSKGCNCRVVDWVGDDDGEDKIMHRGPPSKNEKGGDHKELNIVIVDFFENCSLLPAVVNSNRAC